MNRYICKRTLKDAPEIKGEGEQSSLGKLKVFSKKKLNLQQIMPGYFEKSNSTLSNRQSQQQSRRETQQQHYRRKQRKISPITEDKGLIQVQSIEKPPKEQEESQPRLVANIPTAVYLASGPSSPNKTQQSSIVKRKRDETLTNSQEEIGFQGLIRKVDHSRLQSSSLSPTKTGEINKHDVGTSLMNLQDDKSPIQQHVFSPFKDFKKLNDESQNSFVPFKKTQPKRNILSQLEDQALQNQPHLRSLIQERSGSELGIFARSRNSLQHQKPHRTQEESRKLIETRLPQLSDRFKNSNLSTYKNNLRNPKFFISQQKQGRKRAQLMNKSPSSSNFIQQQQQEKAKDETVEQRQLLVASILNQMADQRQKVARKKSLEEERKKLVSYRKEHIQTIKLAIADENETSFRLYGCLKKYKHQEKDKSQTRTHQQYSKRKQALIDQSMLLQKTRKPQKVPFKNWNEMPFNLKHDTSSAFLNNDPSLVNLQLRDETEESD